MEQRTGSKLGKEYVKAVYCHPAYLTYTQSISRKMLGWMKHKLESRLLGYADDTSLTAESEEEEPLDEGERGKLNSWLNLNIQKKKTTASIPSLHGK